MPRAKVRDEDRRRAPRACVPCKNSKVRCDAKSPCTTCIKRECSSSCKYLTSRSSKGKRTQRSSEASGPSSPEKPSSTQTDQTALNESRNHDESASRNPNVTSETDGVDDEDSTRSPEATQSRMLLSSKGEKVYVGKIASLSLLQFLRQTLRFHMGPSSFTESEFRNVMLEAEVHDARVQDFDNTDLLQEQLLVNSYFEASSGFLDLCTKDEVLSYLAERSLPTSNSRLRQDDTAILCLVIAIGGQSRGHSQYDLQYASRNFTRGRKLAFQGMLNDPSINMIKLFLLLAFYMLGACRRNAAFMYLGVASKAAYALGLHSRSQSRTLTGEERSLRTRVWRSLNVLDVLVNSILGRPSMLPVPRLQAGEAENDRAQYPTGQALDASYGICSHLAMIVCKISESDKLDCNVAEQFLQRLSKWTETLPPEQRKFTTAETSLLSLSNREFLIGNTHVACIYYFAVILITRPFLLSHLTTTLQTRAKQGGSGAANSIPKDDSVEILAQACLDASSYMTQLCHKVMEADGLLNNMCILKALMFAAGLLLGFGSFVDGKASDTEDAFQASIAVLKNFSDLSPQARLYCKILTDFQDAITTYQQHLVEQRRRSRSQYVTQPFSVDIGQQQSTNTPYPTPDVGEIPGAHFGDFTLESNNMFTGMLSPGIAPVYDAVNFPLLWDDFNFEWQPDQLSLS